MPQSPWENRSFAQLSLAKLDARFLPGTGQEVAFLAEELQLPPRARILDLGCGAGRHSIELARRGHQVVGVDISETMLSEAESRARQAGVRVQFLRMDLADLAQALDPECSFDAAFCLCESGLCVLGGETQDLRFLAAVADRLVPGGGLALTTFNAVRKYRALSSAFDHVRSIVHWEGPSDDSGAVLREDQRVYTPSELRMLLLLSGFQEVSVWGCSPGNYTRRPLAPDDVEMLLIARR